MSRRGVSESRRQITVDREIPHGRRYQRGRNPESTPPDAAGVAAIKIVSVVRRHSILPKTN